MSDENNEFSLNTPEFQALGVGLNTLNQMDVNRQQLSLQTADLQAKLDTAQLAFTEREAERAYQTAQTISNIEAGAARRGLATGSETSQEAVLERAKVQSASDFINYSNRQRSLLFSQEIAEYNKKQADALAVGNAISSIGKIYAADGGS